MGSEKIFENGIKTFLKEQGCWYVKYWSGGTQTKEGMKKFTRDGVPDLLCCCDGFFIGIEVKAPTGRPSKLQIYNLRKIDEAGGFAFLLYPKDFGKFKKFILSLKGFEKSQEWVDKCESIYEDLKGVWEAYE